MKKARLIAAALCAVLLLCGFTVPAYAYSDEGGTGGADLWEGLDPAETAPAPSPEPEQKPFTPSGTGTVVDNATDQEGKEFFTIITPDESIFYLVIDRQRGSENVYFLNAVTLADLAALAESAGEELPGTLAPAPTPAPDPDPEPSPEPEPEAGAKGNAAPLLLGLAVVLIGGGAGWYFKIYRPKHQKAPEPEEDYDVPDPYEDGDPWDEEGGGDGEQSE
ncbi:hypothetical protein CE91St41_26110 [Oscillospiraceae bacterium]|nr:hypothetical protein CE91St40_11430 [Oscillospiraceae bacterium]BDF75722.1 hypothetical protein CE91St41_26110 [Oscillospiraceae bacterium]